MKIVKAKPAVERLTIGQMQLKVLRQLAKSKPGESPPDGFFNTRGSGVRQHTLNDMLLSGLVALKTKETKHELLHFFSITPLGKRAIKQANVAELPASGYRKVIPLPTRKQRNDNSPRRRRVA